MGDAHLDAYTKPLRTRGGGEAHASLGFRPGIDLTDVAGSPEQKLGVVSLRGAASWADVHPVDVSELVRDLERI
jgi:hypothetical protein